ncbi:MAG: hypothetical protein PHQ52_00370 [Candidatus Omnitrophica bacterium]|nr:hypothetical protein [Candidatus Omnitrophota bacterium]
MKAYKKSKITRVKLDSKQAIIAVCQVSGDYFNTNSNSLACVGDVNNTRAWGMGIVCNGSVKGISGGSHILFQSSSPGS